jgi:hypothetical protein
MAAMGNWDEDDSEESPPLDTEEGRDEWIEFLLSQDGEQENGGWLLRQAMLVQDGDNMVARFRYDDGREEIFDMAIRRQIEIVKIDPAGSN